MRKLIALSVIFLILLREGAGMEISLLFLLFPWRVVGEQARAPALSWPGLPPLAQWHGRSHRGKKAFPEPQAAEKQLWAAMQPGMRG